MFHHRDLRRRQLHDWIVLDLRRTDPTLPGLLLGERRVFGCAAEHPSGISGAVLTTQITNHDPAGMTVTTADLTRWELVGPPGRLDEAMRLGLELHLQALDLVQWQQVGLAERMDWDTD